MEGVLVSFSQFMLTSERTDNIWYNMVAIKIYYKIEGKGPGMSPVAPKCNLTPDFHQVLVQNSIYIRGFIFVIGIYLK